MACALSTSVLMFGVIPVMHWAYLNAARSDEVAMFLPKVKKKTLFVLLWFSFSHARLCPQGPPHTYARCLWRHGVSVAVWIVCVWILAFYSAQAQEVGSTSRRNTAAASCDSQGLCTEGACIGRYCVAMQPCIANFIHPFLCLLCGLCLQGLPWRRNLQ